MNCLVRGRTRSEFDLKRSILDGSVSERKVDAKVSYLRVSTLWFLLLLTLACIVKPSQANALGLGASEAESYIGEPLNVRVPLFNVRSPQSVSVKLTAERIDYVKVAKLTASIDRSNSQMAVRVTSTKTINEPYINFELKLADGADIVSKKFTVLLNLRADSDQANADRPFAENKVSLSGIAHRKDVMGPYEWAVPGNLPKRFGPVLDGQSLWRVARRLNKAMGVSQSQMMWSLYKANPAAFSKSTIDSLKAGSYLAVPEYSEASRLTENQAKTKLDLLSGVVVAAISGDANRDNGKQPMDKDVDTEDHDPAGQEGQAFQMTGIGEEAAPSASSNKLAGEGIQQVVSSLVNTVNNLSEELVRKDKRIEFLEDQVTELKAFIEKGGAVVKPVGALSDTVVEPMSSAQPEPAVPLQINGVEKQFSSVWWQWVLLAFAALTMLGLLFRERLGGLARSLNLFGSNDDIALAPVGAGAMSPYAPSSGEWSKKPKPDYSVLSAIEKASEEAEDVGGISYQELDDHVSFDDDDELELVSVEEFEEEREPTFDERFAKLLEDQDYEFAREFLDFARYNEIDEDRYHCERLHLLKTMNDEDGFYDYYYEIESKIPDFPMSLQTQISQFVVQLAQQQ